jgi:hypothetical protein
MPLTEVDTLTSNNAGHMSEGWGQITAASWSTMHAICMSKEHEASTFEANVWMVQNTFCCSVAPSLKVESTVCTHTVLKSNARDNEKNQP